MKKLMTGFRKPKYRYSGSSTVEDMGVIFISHKLRLPGEILDIQGRWDARKEKRNILDSIKSEAVVSKNKNGRL